MKRVGLYVWHPGIPRYGRAITDQPIGYHILPILMRVPYDALFPESAEMSIT